MAFLTKNLLVLAAALLVVEKLQAAAINVDFLVDGLPVGRTQVLLDNQPVGVTSDDGKFWHQGVDKGRHTLTLENDNNAISYNFSVKEDQAAFITIASESGKSKFVSTVQYAALADVEVSETAGAGKIARIQANNAQVAVPGSLAAKITAADKKTPLRNVEVTVLGVGISTRSDRDGKFNLELAPGDYEILLEHPDYQSSSLSAIRVLPKMALMVEVALVERALSEQLSSNGPDIENPDASPSIEEVFVVAAYRPHNPIEIERLSTSVVDSIDFGEIARFDDSTVSAAIRRVVGVSLERGRYPIVRGMKSRYQSSFFDGAILPSTDPGRRDLPLDIFPSGVMQGLSLQKTATADVPGGATAGHIDMQTKEVPGEGYFKLSSAYSYGDAHSGDAYMVKGGDKDYLGFDDGFRDMPEEARQLKDFYFANESGGLLSAEETEALGESFDHYGIYKGRAKGNMSLSATGGNSWDFGEQQRVGFIGAFRYGNKWTNNEKTQYRFGLFQVQDEDKNYTGEIASILRSATKTFDNNNIIDVSGMLNFLWELNDQHQFGLNNIALRHTTNSAEVATQYEPAGDLRDKDLEEMFLQTDPELWETNERQRTYNIDWIEEQLLSSQLWGEHSLSLPYNRVFSYFGEMGINWRAMTATTEYDRPEAKKYTYKSAGPQNSYDMQAGRENNHNIWELMSEDNTGYKLDFSLPVNENGELSVELKAGIYNLNRAREGSLYVWSYSGGGNSEVSYKISQGQDPANIFTPETIVGSASDDGYVISTGGIKPENDIGWKGNRYQVEQSSKAKYVLAEASLWEKLRVNLGVRQEKFVVDADQYAYTVEPLRNLLDEKRRLPSLGLTYLFSESWQLRAVYSKTASWPEVFELIPRRFRNTETLTSYEGNPDLNPADIKNYDLRLEWYPSANESVTLAVFDKKITNAIENVFDAGGQSYNYYTFDNIPKAMVKGWELDLRKIYSLGNSGEHELFVQFNYADIISEVELPKDTRAFDHNRPLQGQPDYIVNLQLGYDHFASGQQLTLAFNRKGEELAVVAPPTGKDVSNVYTLPFNDLKLIYSKRFENNLKLSFSAENILDSEQHQEYENFGVPYLKYKPGSKFKLSASYQF